MPGPRPIGVPRFKTLIAGDWIDGARASRNINPSNTADLVGEYAQADTAQTRDAIGAAQAAFAKVIPYGPVNRDALAMLDDKTKAVLPTTGPTNTMLNVDYWAEHGPAVVERFNKWVLV